MSEIVAAMIEGWRSDLQGKPKPGFYKVRLRAYCPWVAARIWRLVPRDDMGRPSERGRPLMLHVNGEPAVLSEWWSRLRPVTEAEYRTLLAHAPVDPFLRVLPARKKPE